LKDITTPEEVLSKESSGISYKQVAAFNYILDKVKSSADWMIALDVDEFLHIRKGSLKSFLRNYRDYNGIYLYWKFISSCGRVKSTNEVLKSYTRELINIPPKMGCSIKSFINLNKIGNICRYTSAHLVEQNLVNTVKLKTKIIACYRYAYIRHYFTKSWEDWIYRFKYRGDLVPGNRKIE